MSHLFVTVKWNLFFLPGAPQAFYLADGMYHVISRHSSLNMKNDSGTAGLSVQTLSCHVYIIHPSCTSTLSFNQGDFVLTSDMDVCEGEPHPLMSIHSHSINSFFGSSLPLCSSRIQSFSRLFDSRSSSICS